jgi:hypothetical protein
VPDPIVRVEGARQLRRALSRAGDDLSDFRDANAEVARIAGAAGRSRAPRRTGTLAASVRTSGTKTQAVVRAGGARVPYAGPIHWGWAARHIAPHPFLSEGAQATEPVWLAVYMAKIDRIIARVAREAHP